MIETQSTEMPAHPAVTRASMAQLVGRARSMVIPGERHILGITGAPGAGKSTLCDALVTALGADAAIVGMDAFHLANVELERLGRAERKGAPDTFDPHGYAALLTRLRNSTMTVYAPVFRREIEESIAGAVPIDPTVSLVITEGNYLLLDSDGWEDARLAIDEIWYLDVPREELRSRLVTRHQAHGRTPLAAESWVADVDMKNAERVEEMKTRADVIVELTDAPAARHVSSEGAH